jgi:hypothetical protein
MRVLYLLLMTGLVLYLVRALGSLVYAVFPHDPPPIQDGESIASRLGKLHWD